MPEDRQQQLSGQQSGSSESNQSFMVSAPSINLPKGGGAIKGIGEKFAANPVTGTGSMSVPIATSPGRSGFGPQLSLSYDSGAGNGPFGLGWHLSLPSITRKTDKGLPRYFDTEESDVFILSGAEDLVPCLQADGQPEIVPPRTVNGIIYSIDRYRPRIEGLFARIERWTNKGNLSDIFWRSISKDNITTWYGRTLESRIYDPGDPARIFRWLICESHDDKGNVISYGFKEENSDDLDLPPVRERNRANERNRTDRSRSASRYLKRIKYGNHAPYFPQLLVDQPWPSLPGNDEWFFEAVFDYGEHDPDTPSTIDAGAWNCRNDPFSSYRAGFEVRTYRLCQRVLMYHHIPDLSPNEKGYDGLVRSTDFTYSYEQDPHNVQNSIYSKIVSITQNGYKRNNGGYDKHGLPPLEFEYSQANVNEDVHEVDSESLENLPEGVDGARYQWVDLDGEGISSILTEQAGSWFYKRNVSALPVEEDDGSFSVKARFEPLIQLAKIPSLAVSGGNHQFLDLAGDGQLDVVMLDRPTPGFYERTTDEEWESFRYFKSLPNIDWKDANLKFVDLNGDGHADVLITENEAFTWYSSLAEEGFASAEKSYQPVDEEQGPRLVFADGTQSVYLSDLSGDGLSDLARIRNGEVCYWPNLGYGRFGAKVTMDNAPCFDHTDQFDQKRIRLADIDGSGTTDIIYLHSDGVHIYFNQSGNSWSDVQALNAFPKIDNLSSVMAVDLLGNGTACLVWSSSLPGNTRSPMRYIQLMKGKPHLLTKSINNLGAETHVTYALSTKFYLQDEKDGKPWISKIPFPVHVVESVETYDYISKNRFTTRYAYHHGYFDGQNREFRGFSMVEQWGSGEYKVLSNNNQPSENIDPVSYVPPIHTKTWFHTGIYFGRNRVSDYFAGLLDNRDVGEYYPSFRAGDAAADAQAKALLLDDTFLPHGLSIEEEREACRALKGSMLRQEVYALDGTDKEKHPYTVTEQNFTIERLQSRHGNRHGVFLTHPREAISYHYERDPDDPRTTHAMTLEVDDYGNVLKSLAIGYGRRPGKSPLQGMDKEKQEQTLITYTEGGVSKVISDPDDYRTPLPVESRTYEITGYDLAAGEMRFSFDKFTESSFQALKAPTLTEVGYERPADYTKKQRRLIEHLHTLYRRKTLNGLLPTGEIDSMALPGESYKLAFTPELLTDVYGDKVTNAMLEDEGKYVDFEGDASWWIPSGRVFYSPDSNDTPAIELAEAKGNFFLPRRYRDPFHTNPAKMDSLVDYDSYNLLVQETRDILGNRVTAGERDADPTQPLVNSGIDYRVLQPKLMMDPNRNRTEVAFDTFGMVVGTAVMGKPLPEPVEGDTLTGFVADPTQPQLDEFIAKPREPSANDPQDSEATQVVYDLLKNATTRIIYDLDRFQTTQRAHPNEPEKWEPTFAATLARETHFNDPGGGQTDIQISFSYSDGFGREIQKKIQAEKGKVPKRDANGRIVVGPDNQPEMRAGDANPRWVGSGWTIYNNKGKPVRQYEPFFSDMHKLDFDTRIGVTPILFYDPVGRVVATLHPNHTYEKVVFDPWKQTSYDVNDTVTFDPESDEDVKGFVLNPDGSQRLPKDEYFPTWHALRTNSVHATTFAAQYPELNIRTNEMQAAQKTEAHADTPTTAHFDALGRPFMTMTHNKVVCANHPQDGADDYFVTRIELDIEGNQREVLDAKGRIVMRYDYYMAGPEQDEGGETETTNRIHQISMEAGERWMLNDVAGNPIRAWGSRGFMRRMTYDELRRPTGLYVTENGNQRLAEETRYGEAQGDATNHRTRVYQVCDGAGVVTSLKYDFKGNLLASQRELLPYTTIPDWQQNEPADANDGRFASSTTFDALNRPVTATSPDGSIYSPTFNTANLLDKIDVNLRGAVAKTTFVKNINYDAKGQRELIEYGCGAGAGQSGVTTTYDYDPYTYRLVNLKTTRPAGLNGLASSIFTNKKVVQDLHYIYDPTGNITHIEDAALKPIFYNNEHIDPVSRYTYDALYRLIKAEGREHISQAGHGFIPLTNNRDYPFVGHRANANDLQALRNYSEFYDYDAVGNFNAMSHSASNVVWTRSYEYQEASLVEGGKMSNRLTRSILGSGQNFVENYSYDAHGNMEHMQHFANQYKNMHWDFEDQLIKIDLAGGGKAHYIYDAAGQRVRKVIESQNGKRQKERIYLGGYEVYREYKVVNGKEKKELERQSLHVMDDKQRIALVETQTIKNGNDVNDPVLLQRYQLGNHLGSASLELAEDGALISYEEYHSYGTTAFQAGAELSMKRYRYAGKERDEESGLYYYGARYYASWLGCWMAVDPLITSGEPAYVFVRNSPIKFTDELGYAPTCILGHTCYISGQPVRNPEQAVDAAQGQEVYSAEDLGELASDQVKAEKNLARAEQDLVELKRSSHKRGLIEGELWEKKSNAKRDIEEGKSDVGLGVFFGAIGALATIFGAPLFAGGLLITVPIVADEAFGPGASELKDYGLGYGGLAAGELIEKTATSGAMKVIGKVAGPFASFLNTAIDYEGLQNSKDKLADYKGKLEKIRWIRNEFNGGDKEAIRVAQSEIRMRKNYLQDSEAILDFAMSVEVLRMRKGFSNINETHAKLSIVWDVFLKNKK